MVRPRSWAEFEASVKAGEPFAFSVVNLGCKVNRVESDAVQATLSSAGGILVDQALADVVVVNTCTVTGEADKKARKAARHALSANPHALVVVTGCAVAIDADTYRELDERVDVVQRAELMASLDHIGMAGVVRMGADFHTRVSMKVQDGCDHACTYCIVHVARGSARSVPLADVVSNARRYLEHGAKEIVLTGIDLASYRDGSNRLAHLVTALLEEADKACAPGDVPARIRASSIEPQTLDESLVDILATSGGRLCRHLHLPLQSGSSKVLREMARPYTAAEFGDLVGHLRERVPSISLTTDVIVGFPGETDDDFAQSMELARSCSFSKIHVFPYSKRANTPAAARDDQVDALVKSERAAQLRELSAELRKLDYERRRGTREYVLVEDEKALTESYHEVAVPDGSRQGDLLEVVLR